MAYEGLMVSVSGVRGRVGEALTPEIMAKFAAGFGAWALARAGGKARIVVGRDSRVSGPMFQPVVLSALQSVGCDVIDVGMVPTPTVQLAVEPFKTLPARVRRGVGEEAERLAAFLGGELELRWS